MHVHTTCSDGRRTPAETQAFYRERGYHFLAVTDHDRITDMSVYATGGFLTLPGAEVTCGSNPLGQPYHIVLIGPRHLEWPADGATVQDALDVWTATAPLVFLAHPYWSGMTLADILPLENLAGIEVYNNFCQKDVGKGLASVHWDDALARGRRWCGFAVDDTHGAPDDAAGGWVWVKSAALDAQSILNALRAGAFYASSGPTIHDFRVERDMATVRCSEAAVINFIGHSQWGRQRRAAPGTSLTEASWRLTGHERYLRVECIDHAGRAAWSNPIYLSD